MFFTVGENADEKSTVSGRGEEDVFSEHVRTKAMHVISSILHEAKEEVASLGSGHSESLDEITILASSVRVHPLASRISKTLLRNLKKPPSSDQMTDRTFLPNKLLPAACETYSCVQKKVCRIILKVQASVSPKKEPHQLTSEHSEDSSSRCSSERVSVSTPKTVKANVSSTSARGEEERLHLDTCTEEIIAKILDLYRTQGQKQTSDLFQSTCTHLVRDVLVRNIQILAKRQKLRKTVRSVCYRKLSHNFIRYLKSAAWEMTHSVSREIEECLKAGSRNKTQTGLSRVSNMSAFDHANIFAPFRLFGHVRNDVENIFSMVKEGRWPNRRAKMITQDSVFERSSSHHGCLSRGFAGRLAGNKNSAVNQLKSLLSSLLSRFCWEEKEGEEGKEEGTFYTLI